MPLSPARRRLMIGVGLAAAAAAGVGAQWLWQARRAPADVDPAPAVAMVDLHGITHDLAALRGKVVLLNFWATWCAPCMNELPLLVQAQADYGARGLQILGPALDEREAVEEIVTRFHVAYPVSADFAATGRLLAAFGNEDGALPYSVLIDREGHVVERILGGLHPEQLRRLIEDALGS